MAGLQGAADLDMSLGDALVSDGMETTAPLTAPSPPPPPSGGDVLTPNFYVTANPSGVVLDLDNRRAVEGALNAAVLECGVAVVGTTGLGGAYETCALHALGHDRDVAQRFAGGLYNLSFGQGTDPGDVVRQLVNIVFVSGGVDRAADMLAAATVYMAAKETSSWFSSNSSLFICDDLWETETNEADYFSDLYLLVDSHNTAHATSQLLVAFHSRPRYRSPCTLSGRTHFSGRDSKGQGAVTMLCAHAEQSVGDLCGSSGVSCDSLYFVLVQCAGLVHVLDIAGRAIAESVGTVSGYCGGRLARD
jgi:hypothetical protein